jgi:outer membrane protein TolC
MVKMFQILGVFLMSSCTAALAQNPPDTLIGLKDAVVLAQQHYHLLQAHKYTSEAAAKNVDVVKYSKLPSIDATYQAGIATANNLTGMFYPNGILPMTGPPSTNNSYSPATGSAARLLLNWQAATFGEWDARINEAMAEAKAQNSFYQNELFGHSINVISSYLDVLLAFDLVNIHRYNVERVRTNLGQSQVLARAGIKAGVDTALFLSELSKARVELMNTQKLLEIKQWLLAQMIALDALPVPADTTFLNRLPTATIETDTAFSMHPLVQYQQSRVDASWAKEQLLKKSFLPKLNIWGTTFARGSGFEPDGTRDTWNGLTLSRFNYGAGVQLAFPIMKYGEVKRQMRQQSLLSKAALESKEDSKAALTTQQRIAQTTFVNSISVAKETQVQLKSGSYAFSAMQDRYNTGLVNLADLIQAQYSLLQAELDNKKAYWDAWRALLLQAAVRGDINIFLNEIR